MKFKICYNKIQKIKIEIGEIGRNMKKFNYSYALLIFIVAFNLRLGISSVPPIQLIIQESLKLSNLEVSLLTGMPVICMGIFAFLVGKVQEKYGMRKSIFALLLVLGIGTLARGFVNDYIFLIITTFCIGFSIAIIGPLLSGFIKKEFPDHGSILIGIYSSAMGIGSLVVSNTTKGITDLWNWQWGLAVWGIISIAAGIIWIIFSPEESTENTQKIHVKIDFMDINIWKMIMFFGVQSGIFYGFSAWLIPFLKDRGIKEEYTISLLTFYVAMQMIFGFIIPVLMHKIGSARKWGTFSAVCMALGSLIPALFETNLITAVIIITLMSIGLGGSFPIAMILPLEYSENSEEAGVITGVVQAIGYVLGGVMPLVFGYVVDKTKNYDNLFYQMVIGSVILVIIGMSKIHRKNTVNQ